ncbi:MAG: NYN domain-containing protein [Planctomycetes bacterium]|nr:NYN domain-containing protein [Planctomycetota bacterium]
MAALFLIIDGYNLMHAAGLSQARYAPGDLQRQRHRLLVRLANALTAEERLRCTVVFDAMEAPSGLERHYRHAEIRIQFAEPGHDADSLIEALIDAHTAPSQLLIVSSDHRLQKAARQRRAESVDSEVYLQQLAARARTAAVEKTGPAPSKPTAAGSGEDVTYWMGEFGAIDVDAIAKSEDSGAESAAGDPWQKSIDELQQHLNQGADLDDWLNRPPDRKGEPPDRPGRKRK